ncbi:hypothetical protein ETD86_19155 [Nonomuraea turkmeniaca]|uniref:Uncharacterized protein n=1 Tax=Nonomuraea turkmeniaca TaxID=103838 RepID=A0A5S4FIJ3_9ACTN|nr:hypothetical protein [Nonomuraea turkmeniaca]TMR20190.1 hypothetical protein ETD86_19155 [Nonomuraea turkmeniaca]
MGSIRCPHRSGSRRDRTIAAAMRQSSASVILRLRARLYRRIHAAESADSDADGVPDLYQSS